MNPFEKESFASPQEWENALVEFCIQVGKSQPVSDSVLASEGAKMNLVPFLTSVSGTLLTTAPTESRRLKAYAEEANKRYGMTLKQIHDWASSGWQPPIPTFRQHLLKAMHKVTGPARR